MTKRLYILFLILLSVCEGAFAVTLSLDSCLQLARRNNPSVRKAQLDIARAEEVKAQALTKYFPQVQATAVGFHALHPLVEVGIDDIGNAAVRDLLTTLYGNYGAGMGLDHSLSLLQYGYVAGVSAVQPVFVGGKIVAGNRLAKVGVEAAKLQAEVTTRDLLEQVEQTYWLVYGLQQKQQLIDEGLTLLNTLSYVVSAAVAAGLALPSDTMQVALRRDEVLTRQLQLQSGLSLARQALALSVGLPMQDSIVIADSLSFDPMTMPQNISNEETAITPEQQLLGLQVRAAELTRRMTLADALPQVAVGAGYGYSHLQANILKDGLNSNNKGNGTLFVTMRVPLTAWWETAHKLKEQRLAIEQAQLDADYLGAQLNLRAQQAADQLIAAQAMVLIQQNAYSHAQEAYRLTQINYEAGRATITELLRQQNAITQSHSDLTDALIAYRIALRRYSDLNK
ncbi:MAG: TolC family protein [Paludibacteraceae bacterium]|nr:TolC family protein [Paludibacteraceae bacterium]